MNASKLYVLASLLFALPLFTQNGDRPGAAKVTVREGETVGEVIASLRKSGNDVALTAASEAGLKLTAGAHDFWPLLDEVCRQAHLQARVSGSRVELSPADAEGGPRFVAYDGPFRAAITRRTITAYDDPALDRLSLQIELACEPRMQPLLLKLPASGISWKWADPKNVAPPASGVASYGFEGEKIRRFDVRLPRPSRGVKQIDQLGVRATLWVSSQRLDLDLPLKPDAELKQQETTFRIQQVNEQAARTWEVVTTLTYPARSMEWESHQAGLLGNVSLSLVNGNRTLTPIGQEVRTDESHRLEIHWLFHNVPGRPDAWRLRGHVPSAPVAYPLRLEFKNIELP